MDKYETRKALVILAKDACENFERMAKLRTIEIGRLLYNDDPDEYLDVWDAVSKTERKTR